MTTNEVAAATINDAMTKILLTYDGASSVNRTRIRFAANRLKEEWDALRMRNAATRYSEITGGITKATGRLNVIAAERDRLATGLVSASQILGVVTKVLALISK
ncbi:hypothetical protein [Agrobacterium sp. 22-226-1]